MVGAVQNYSGNIHAIIRDYVAKNPSATNAELMSVIKATNPNAQFADGGAGSLYVNGANYYYNVPPGTQAIPQGNSQTFYGPPAAPTPPSGLVGGGGGSGGSVGGGGVVGGGNTGGGGFMGGSNFKTIADLVGGYTQQTPGGTGMGMSGIEGRLSALLDDPESITKSAAYKFRVGQGQEALQRQMGAKGMLGSGNRLMELTKYGQDMASQEYDNQFNRLGGLFKGYQESGDRRLNTQMGTAADVYKTDVGAASDKYKSDTLANTNLWNAYYQAL